MAVGLKPLSPLLPVSGIRLGTTAAGIRYRDRDDLVVIECVPGTTAAAVFTRNRFCAAPVIVAREHLGQIGPRALLINSGNANAGTGHPGEADARACCQALAERLGCEATAVLPFSTGVIGQPLPVAALVGGVDACVADLGGDNWERAAHAIMTTDTAPKGVSRQFQLGARTVTITGIAKGSGMIRPDMATMLAFVATDAKIGASVLEELVRQAVAESFNRITVDGDTSTNDACVVLATGRAGAGDVGEDAEDRRSFARELTMVLRELAQAIVRDAEGATKFITVTVVGGANEDDCLAVAYTIAHSPLVKTAFFASDPNWGRILAAVGRSPVPDLTVERVSVYLDDVRVVRDGGLDPEYREAAGQTVMEKPEIVVRVDLGMGAATATVWTCDLSHDYVKINAEYRT